MLVNVLPTDSILLPAAANRGDITLTNYGPFPVWLAFDEAATVGSGPSVGPNGAQYVVSRPDCLLALHARHGGVGPVEVEVTVEPFDIEDLLESGSSGSGSGSTTLAALTDVDLTGIQDGDLLAWDASAGKLVKSDIKGMRTRVLTWTPADVAVDEWPTLLFIPMSTAIVSAYWRATTWADSGSTSLVRIWGNFISDPYEISPLTEDEWGYTNQNFGIWLLPHDFPTIDSQGFNLSLEYHSTDTPGTTPPVLEIVLITLDSPDTVAGSVRTRPQLTVIDGVGGYATNVLSMTIHGTTVQELQPGIADITLGSGADVFSGVIQGGSNPFVVPGDNAVYYVDFADPGFAGVFVGTGWDIDTDTTRIICSTPGMYIGWVTFTVTESQELTVSTPSYCLPDGRVQQYWFDAYQPYGYLTHNVPLFFQANIGTILRIPFYNGNPNNQGFTVACVLRLIRISALP